MVSVASHFICSTLAIAGVTEGRERNDTGYRQRATIITEACSRKRKLLVALPINVVCPKPFGFGYKSSE